ncbi:MAG: hypothetical protein QOI25_3989 [Mycobacterium sp.]|jgi:hypothetical protein|nr:hypothetical protein [Mycobacterium sp.]
MSSTETSSNRHAGDSRRGGVLPVVAVILALAALGLAAWAAFRPAPAPSAPTFTAAQQSDAKATVCSASDLVRRGVSLNTNLPVPGGEGDVTGSLAVAANARVSLSDGGQYLLARLDPATPTELAEAVRQFANKLMDIGAGAIAGAQNTDPAQAARLRDADAANIKIAEACK